MFMKDYISTLVLLGLAIPAYSAVLVDFDFSAVTNTNGPNEDLPLTAVSIYDSNLETIGTGAATGLAMGSLVGISGPPPAEWVTGEFAWDGNYGNNPGVNTTAQTLQESFDNNRYVGFTIDPKAGVELDLAGENLTVNWYVQFGSQSPRDLSLFTSVGGFTGIGDAVETKDNFNLSGNGGNGNNAYTQLTFTLPNTAAYDGITDPFEVRLYFHDALFGGKLTKIDQLTLDGDATVVIPEPDALLLLLVIGTIAGFCVRRRRVS